MDSYVIAYSGSAFTGPAALVVAVAALSIAVAWRTVRLVRVRRGVNAALRDPDPSIRSAAVQQAAEIGLGSTASALLRAVREETDPSVLAAVVVAVATRQWEPASTARIVELRLWAKAYAEKHPELRRGHLSRAPLLPGVAGTVPPPSLDPSRADEFRTRRDQVSVPVVAPTDEAVNVPHTEAAPDDDALGPVRVLVTGAGGPAGIAVIRALRGRGHHVVAVDADPTAVGLRLADQQHVIPRFDDSHYLAALLRVATLTDVQALVCTVAEEYASLAGAADYLAEAGVRTLMPPLRAVDLCMDKWAFAQHMRDSGLPSPATGLDSAQGVAGPWIVKPRFGRGSRDVMVAQTRSQLATALRQVPDPIVQTQLTGREFTADVLVDVTGAVLGVAPRWRTETRGGISTKGTTFEDAEVTNVVSLVIKSVGLVGPANVQGFVTEDGAVAVHEVNARFSGGLPLTLAAGADMVEEYLRGVMGLPMRSERLVARPGVTMMRFFCEVFEG
ncbi:MAG: carbamoyl-phosphate synthase large subunit [Actinomycetota bacterium]|nr:carbamoyl-phosphate synthase large subunit [Actinomycetota bacterium]